MEINPITNFQSFLFSRNYNFQSRWNFIFFSRFKLWSTVWRVLSVSVSVVYLGKIFIGSKRKKFHPSDEWVLTYSKFKVQILLPSPLLLLTSKLVVSALRRQTCETRSHLATSLYPPQFTSQLNFTNTKFREWKKSWPLKHLDNFKQSCSCCHDDWNSLVIFTNFIYSTALSR